MLKLAFEAAEAIGPAGKLELRCWDGFALVDELGRDCTPRGRKARAILAAPHNAAATYPRGDSALSSRATSPAGATAAATRCRYPRSSGRTCSLSFRRRPIRD
mgnify:CR=1 FL=1